MIKQNKKNLASNIADTDILDLMGVTVRGIPSLAGVMTFSLYPQTWFPSCASRHLLCQESKIGDQTDDGNRVDKPEYPLRAVRESILNGLIHRDYSQYIENTPMSIEMYRNRIVFRSSGVLFGRESIQMLGKSRPEPRNAVLMNMLEVLKITENRYSGMPTMYHNLRELDMPDPEQR